MYKKCHNIHFQRSTHSYAHKMQNELRIKDEKLQNAKKEKDE